MNNSDTTRFGRVAVLMGGTSAEREVSLNSGTAVLNALQRQGIDAHAVDAGEHPVEQLQQQPWDRVFIVLHGRGGEDGVIQGALEAMGLPYTGSGVLGSALGMDKLRSKALWRGLGMPVAPHVRLTGREHAEDVAAELGLPVIIKPAREGSSIGMARVETPQQLASAYSEAAALDADVFAEAWLPGAEYTVSLLGERALPVIRLEVPGGFYDYHAKYQANDTRYLVPCGLEPAQEQALQELALRAFDALGAHGWGRVDLRCDADGEPKLLEINTIPGMTDHSLVPMAAAAAGIDFDQLVVHILESSER